MSEAEAEFAMQAAWDRASSDYLERRGNDVAVVSYGNLAPSERTLKLLGDVRGKRVLDFGCGGGHNAVACALAGAAVVGVDVSGAQLAAAQQLAQAHAVDIVWQHGAHAVLGEDANGAYDVVLAIQVLQYVDDAAATLQALQRTLCPDGVLVLSIDHPMRECFFDEEVDEFSPFPIRRYDDVWRVRWAFNEQVPMYSQHRPLGQWLAMVTGAGLVVQQLLEIAAPLDQCDELWPEDSPLAPLRNIAHTAIVVATRG